MAAISGQKSQLELYLEELLLPAHSNLKFWHFEEVIVFVGNKTTYFIPLIHVKLYKSSYRDRII